MMQILQSDHTITPRIGLPILFLFLFLYIDSGEGEDLNLNVTIESINKCQSIEL